MATKKHRASKQEVLETPGVPAPDALAPVDGGMDSDVDQEPDGCPIVGIGASAGGLEALLLFLKNVPESSGIAFAIVQHLDPTHKGVMPELLQRGTSMTVRQVADQTRVQENCVYVIPPNKDMSILHGVLHLLDPHAPRGQRLPIDFFFRSLADDQQSRSVGVILSGMGSDGTQGLRAIKEKSGATFVQDPASAKFDSMPRSAVEASLADVVAPIEELPGKIVAYLQHKPVLARTEGHLAPNLQGAVDKIVILLRSHTGHDFSLYKKKTICRRIDRRMGLHQIDDISNYVRFLQGNPQEVELLFKELLIGVTNFFRDPPDWDKLKSTVFPALLKDRDTTQPLRAWLIGCSTGEEAYSLVITFKEVLEQLKPAENVTLQVFATDINKDAVDKARTGIFPSSISKDVSPDRLGRYFVEVEQGWQVSKPVRDTVIFAVQNIIMDPPFTKLDLIFCRNLLIYLDPGLQKKLLPLFHYSLNPGGYLFLGSAETTNGFGHLFAPLDEKTRLHRRLDTGPHVRPLEFPPAFSPSKADVAVGGKEAQPQQNLQFLAEQLLLHTCTPAAVLVNSQGDILYISGRTGKYLEPTAGKANWNIFAMAREGLRHELHTVFRKALSQKDPLMTKNLKVVGCDETQAVDLMVQAVSEPEPLKGLVLVVFHDVEVAAPFKSGRKYRGSRTNTALLEQMEAELEQTREELRTTREEMQNSQQELISTNEEHQSTNEELQSANEEMTTSKEEMQSMYEELQTLNHELQAKMEALSRINSDMKNLLDSTEVATLFLDDALHVRLFTPGANKIFKLIQTDIGRSITDFASDLRYPELAEHAREVVRTLIFHEQEVPTADGRWFRVRIMPYRTLENVIDGAVITFTDITVSKTLEAQLRETQAGLKEQIRGQDVEMEQAGMKLKAQTKGRTKSSARKQGQEVSNDKENGSKT